MRYSFLALVMPARFKAMLASFQPTFNVVTP